VQRDTFEIHSTPIVSQLKVVFFPLAVASPAGASAVPGVRPLFPRAVPAVIADLLRHVLVAALPLVRQPHDEAALRPPCLQI